MLPIHKLLCPTDFSEPARTAVQAAVELANHFGAEICLVHIVPTIPLPSSDPAYEFELPEYERILHEDAEQKLKALAAEIATPKVPVRTIVGHGQPADEIVIIAGSEKSEMIVIATHGATGWRHLVFGSVAERVVRMAPCPVLTIRCPDVKPQT